MPRTTPTSGLLAVIMMLAAVVAVPDADAAGARLYKSGPIQISADGRWLWVANPDNGSVARIDTASDAITEFVLPGAGGDSPRGISIKDDGSEVWVSCHDSDRVYVLEAASGAVLQTIALPWGSGPYSVALSRDQARALVTSHRGRALAVIDATSYAVTHVIEPVYHSALGIAWMENGVDAWVTHSLADGEHPFLSRVSFAGAEPKLVTQIRVGATQPQNDTDTAPRPAEGGYLTHRGHAAQIPSASGRSELWIPTQYNNIHNTSWSPDSTIQSTIRHLDLSNRTLPNTNNDKVVFTAVDAHDPANGNYDGPGWDARVSGPIDIAFSDDGQMGYIVHELSNDLLVFATTTPAVKPSAAVPLTEVAVGDRPIGLVVSPVADLAFVANRLSRDVSVIDLGAGGPVEVRRIATTPLTGEPLSATLLRGARLFHTSADPRISSNDKVSCASCHLDGEHDGRPWSFQNLPGPALHGNRSVQSLLGLSLTFGPADPATGWGQLHLSGDRDEIQDFEHTFQGVNFGGTGFIGAGVCAELDPTCANAGRDPDLDAIASYVMSLEPLERSPFRDDATGSLTDAAVRGGTFFLGGDRANKAADAGCASCHQPRLSSTPGDQTVFADLQFHDIGFRPANEQEFTTGRGNDWRMNTQTLVGVFATAPWEGGDVSWPVSSMLELLKGMAGRATQPNPHGSPDGLTGRQLADLNEFVMSIDGDMTGAEVAALRDTTAPRIVRVEATSPTRLDVWFSEMVDPTTAGDPANYQLMELGAAPVAISAATWDGQNGDRVSLDTTLRTGCGTTVDYVLAPAGAILDAADWATGGNANPLDVADPANQHSFTVGDTFTITLGASGYENITIPVHDSAPVGSGLSTWSHDAVYLHPQNLGFVRFDWQTELQRVAGVTRSADIAVASFSLTSEFGDVQQIELRRTLKPWSDPTAGGDWNQNPVGGPTWRDHEHPNNRWNQGGARALGGTGRSVGDYGAAWDRANVVDLALTPHAINQRVDFAGPEISDAFRFWFDNPGVDYGYALELVAGSQELRFQSWEHELRAAGPVLTITYVVPQSGALPGEVSGRGAGLPLLMAKPSPAASDVFFSFEDLPVANAYNIYEGAIGTYYSHGGLACRITATRNGPRREHVLAPTPGDRYFLVTAANGCGQGPSDLDHPPGLLDCP